ncbi:unnamed protein product, partial [Vitis vinifera]
MRLHFCTKAAFAKCGFRPPTSEVALHPREFLKKTYFPLPLSILADFVSCARAGLVGNIGDILKSTSGCSARQITRDLSPIYRSSTDISAKYRKLPIFLTIFLEIDNRGQISFRGRPISDISEKYRR